MASTWKTKASEEEGSSLILIIFSGMLGLAVILGVVGATSAYIEHKRLRGIADGAALAGAEAFPLEAVSATGSGLRTSLASADVARAASNYVSLVSVNSSTKPRISRAFTADGVSATVELSSQWVPPVISMFMPDGITLRVSSTSRTMWQ